MRQRESTSPTFSFCLISLACIALVFSPLICPVVETNQMRSSTFHAIQSLTGAAKISCSVKSVTGITPSSLSPWNAYSLQYMGNICSGLHLGIKAVLA